MFCIVIDDIKHIFLQIHIIIWNNNKIYNINVLCKYIYIYYSQILFITVIYWFMVVICYVAFNLYSFINCTSYAKISYLRKKNISIQFQFYFLLLNIICSVIGTKSNCCIIIYKKYIYIYYLVIIYYWKKIF